MIRLQINYHYIDINIWNCENIHSMHMMSMCIRIIRIFIGELYIGGLDKCMCVRVRTFHIIREFQIGIGNQMETCAFMKMSSVTFEVECCNFFFCSFFFVYPFIWSVRLFLFVWIDGDVFFFGVFVSFPLYLCVGVCVFKAISIPMFHLFGGWWFY